MTGRTWRNQLPYLAPLVAFWWGSDAHGADPVFVVIEGDLSVAGEYAEASRGYRKVRGRLTDEVGQAVVGTVEIFTDGGKLSQVFPCDAEPGAEPPMESAVALPDGSFCVFIPEVPSETQIRATAPHFRPATTTVRGGREHNIPALTFSEVPETLVLGSGGTSVVGLTFGSTAGEVPVDTRVTLALHCAGAENRLDEAPVAGGRSVRFEIEAPEEGPVGLCDLRGEASARGYVSSRASRPVLVRAPVDLLLKDISVGGGRATVVFDLVSPGSKVDEGVVELRDSDSFLASAPVEQGQATILLNAGLQERHVVARFLPSSPAFVPGDAVEFKIPKATPGFEASSLHALGLLGFCIWLGYAWLRPPRTRSLPPTPIPPREAGLTEPVVSKGKVSGRVLDAHTGSPLEKVRVTLTSVGAERETDLEQVHTDEAGAFSFSTEFEQHPLLRVTFDAPLHVSLRSQLKSAAPTAHLTERRRALIQNLVVWAKKLGPPWHGRLAPTPDAVARVAKARNESETEAWARAVSSAAYSATLPAEETVKALRAPRD